MCRFRPRLQLRGSDGFAPSSRQFTSWFSCQGPNDTIYQNWGETASAMEWMKGALGARAEPQTGKPSRPMTSRTRSLRLFSHPQKQTHGTELADNREEDEK